MEPLNTDTRRKALINFLIFFTITVSLIVVAVFFSFQVPFKENEQLSRQVEIVKNERIFTEKFERNMNDVMRLFDSLNHKDANIILIDGKITEKIQGMNGMIDSDTSFVGDPSSQLVKELYTSVVESLSKFHSAKKELREATSKDVTLGELKQENARLSSELNYVKQSLNVYMMAAAQAAKNN